MTPQQHYDWGLRALKTVLKACGNLLQQEKRRAEKSEGKTLRPLYYITEDSVSEEKVEFGSSTNMFSSCPGKETFTTQIVSDYNRVTGFIE